MKIDDSMIPLQKCAIPEAAAGLRLDQYLARLLEDKGYSRERVKRLILSGKILVSGKPAAPKLRLAGGETLEILDAIVNQPGNALTPEDGGLTLLYQDEHLLVLNKPAGLTVHPAPSQPEGTLVHRLLHHFPGLASMEGLRPGIVHRIDKDTSGLLLVALDEKTRLSLSRAFADRQVDKRYLAVVLGRPDFGPTGELDIDLPLGRHPSIKTRMAVLAKGGRPARTVCRPLWSDPGEKITLLDVAIFTGRTHQIRVHLSHLGHPLLGDEHYGGRAASLGAPVVEKLIKRQMLHAWKLGLAHPETGEPLNFACPPPKDILRPLLHMGRRLQRVAVTGLPGGGKSSLVRFLGELGAPVFNSDAVVAGLYAPGADGWTLLNRRFGDRFTPDPDGPVDKQALFQAMLQDERLRRDVMDIVHPLVRHRLGLFYEAHRDCRLAVAEIPLLFETGWRGEVCDVAVAITAPPGQRLARLLGRGLPAEAAAALDSWQMSEKEKLKAAGLVVENAGSLEDLRRRALDLWKALKDLRRREARQLWKTIHLKTGSPLPGFQV